MGSEVEIVSNLERKLSINISAEEVEAKVNTELNKLAMNANIPGFRRGKIPMKMVKSKFEADVRSEVARDMINERISEILKRENLMPASTPTADLKEIKPNEGINVTVSFEILPEIKLENLESIELEKLVVQDFATEAKEQLERMRKSIAQWNPVERSAKEGDKVEIDFSGALAGSDEPFEGGQAKNFPVLLGDGALLKDFENGILGHTAGEKFNVELRFPNDYHKEDLRDQLVNFAITLHKVSESTMPELDEKFCAHFGVTEGGLDALMERINAEIKDQAEIMSKTDLKHKLYEKLLEKYPLELPKALVENEITHLIELERQQRGEHVIKAELAREDFREAAMKRVQMRLLMSTYVEENKIQADPERMFKVVSQQAKRFQVPFNEVLEWYSKNNDHLEQLKALVIEEKAADDILNKLKFSEKVVSFEQLRNELA